MEPRKSRTAPEETNKKATGKSGVILHVAVMLSAMYIITGKEVNFNVQLQSPGQVTSMDERRDEQLNSKGARPSAQAEEASLGWRAVAASLFGTTPSKRDKAPAKPTLAQVDPGKVDAFIQRFGNVAMSEMRKYGIPASVILANGLLQSAAGQHTAAQAANNYFLLPCDGRTDATYSLGTQCLNRYESAWAGFRGHSLFLKSRTDFQNLDSKDYKSWCKALARTKVWGQKRLGKDLVVIIERYDLSAFDKG